MKTWSCKIGEVDTDLVPKGGDGPMREAVEKAYKELTGKDADFNFSGWDAYLGEIERAAVEDRSPADWYWIRFHKKAAAESMYEAFHDILNLLEERAEDSSDYKVALATLLDVAEIAQSMIDEASPPQPTKEN